MDSKTLQEVLKKVKENTQKRKFKQSYDLIINLKDLDLKKTEQQLDFFTTLHFSRGKAIKICAFAGPELKDEAKNVCDLTIPLEEFSMYDKKKAKKLCEEYEFFIAQANIMGKIAADFGRVLGPRGKMPNPKAGCVVPPKASLKPLYEKLQKTVRVQAKTAPIIQLRVGTEEMDEKELIDNIITLYDQVLHHLPQEHNNIRSVYLKTTMGKPVKVE